MLTANEGAPDPGLDRALCFPGKTSEGVGDVGAQAIAVREAGLGGVGFEGGAAGVGAEVDDRRGGGAGPAVPEFVGVAAADVDAAVAEQAAQASTARARNSLIIVDPFGLVCANPGYARGGAVSMGT